MSTTALAPTAATARIGPNALIQTVAATEALVGSAETAAFLFRHGRPDLLSAPPSTMVDEAEFIALIAELRAWLGVRHTQRILAESGRRTAAYVLANRIPKPIQVILRVLPSNVSRRLLLRAIGQHSWTFAGSAQFAYHLGSPTVLSLSACPECRGMTNDTPLCTYYAAAFETLLRTLVHPNIAVHEVACAAQGAPACRFEVRQ